MYRKHRDDADEEEFEDSTEGDEMEVDGGGDVYEEYSESEDANEEELILRRPKENTTPERARRQSALEAFLSTEPNLNKQMDLLEQIGWTVETEEGNFDVEETRERLHWKYHYYAPLKCDKKKDAVLWNYADVKKYFEKHGDISPVKYAHIPLAVNIIVMTGM